VSTLHDWTEAVCAELAIDPATADVAAVLDLTRDVAHGVARPAAPLTAYLVGVAVGRGVPLADAVGRITVLANGWAQTHQPDEPSRLPDSYVTPDHRPLRPDLP
jgi:hypothetical protein